MVSKLSNKHLPQKNLFNEPQRVANPLGFHENKRSFCADRLADLFLARLLVQLANACFKNQEQDLQSLIFQPENDHALLRGLI